MRLRNEIIMKNKFISNLFWGSWSKDIHSIKEQKKIIYDLGNLDMIVDFNNKSAYLVNGKNIMIHTTLNKCTCDNFKKRRLPCEHIYYLASRLNLPFGLNGTTCDDFVLVLILQNVDYHVSTFIT